MHILNCSVFNPITSQKYLCEGTIKNEIIVQIKHQNAIIGEFNIKTEEYIHGL